MKLTKVSQIDEFLEIVNSCNGNVTLTSQYGDRYNLKSLLSQYVAVGALLGDRGDELELWCSDKADEGKFLDFFWNHPEIF